MKKNIYALFEGRHQLPPNEGALFLPTENPLQAELSEVGVEALCNFAWGEVVRVLVTGATPALTQFIGHCIRAQMAGAQGGLVLLHYDRSTGTYVPEVILGHDSCAPNSTQTVPDLDGTAWVPEHADPGEDGPLWDGNPLRFTPTEWGQWCDSRTYWVDPGVTHRVRFAIGVRDGSIDPHDCE